MAGAAGLKTDEVDVAGAQRFLPVLLCASGALTDGGLAVPFDVQCGSDCCRAFAIRYKGEVHAYLNRCTHVAMELDLQPNRVFDASGHWLICAAHGAVYAPDSGAGVDGPCRGGLQKIALTERDGQVFWQPTERIRSVVFGSVP